MGFAALAFALFALINIYAGLAGDWLTKSVACIILLIERLGTNNTTLAKVGLCQVGHIEKDEKTRA